MFNDSVLHIESSSAADTLDMRNRPTQINVNKSSAVAEMGDRGHNRHGPKNGAVVPLSQGELRPRLTQYGVGRGLLPYQVVSSSIHPFGHYR